MRLSGRVKAMFSQKKGFFILELAVALAMMLFIAGVTFHLYAIVLAADARCRASLMQHSKVRSFFARLQAGDYSSLLEDKGNALHYRTISGVRGLSCVTCKLANSLPPYVTCVCVQ